MTAFNLVMELLLSGRSPLKTKRNFNQTDQEKKKKKTKRGDWGGNPQPGTTASREKKATH